MATACILVHTVHYLVESWHTSILSWLSCGKSRTIDLKGRRYKQVQLSLGGSWYLYYVLSYFSWNAHPRHASVSITGPAGLWCSLIIITTRICWAHASTCSQPSVNKTIIFTLPHIYLYFICRSTYREYEFTWIKNSCMMQDSRNCIIFYFRLMLKNAASDNINTSAPWFVNAVTYLCCLPWSTLSIRNTFWITRGENYIKLVIKLWSCHILYRHMMPSVSGLTFGLTERREGTCICKLFESSHVREAHFPGKIL